MKSLIMTRLAVLLAACLVSSALAASATAATASPGPTISQATATNLTGLQVIFSEAVTTATATNPASYFVSGGIFVTGATLAADQVTVTLVTTVMAPSSSYALTALNITDTQFLPLTTPSSVFSFSTPAAPMIHSAMATSGTSITVVFSRGVMAETATNTLNYAMSGAVITGATLAADQKTVTLTTTRLSASSGYTLSAIGIADLLSPAAAYPVSTCNLATPYVGTVASATATNLVNITVLFTAAVDATAAANPAIYGLTGGVSVTGAVVSADGKTVTLTTTPMTAGGGYTVTAGNLSSFASMSTASFTIPSGPSISSAAATSQNAVPVAFSRNVATAIATNPTNYAISGGAAVNAVTWIDSKTVTLVTSTLTPSAGYTLTVFTIADTLVPPITTVAATAMFTVPGPIIYSVSSSSLGYVLVQFSEPVTAATATNPANYAISSGITVTGATQIDASHVSLATSTMAANTPYTVTARGVTDTRLPPITAPGSTRGFTTPSALSFHAGSSTLTSVWVSFSRSVPAAAITNPANYAISGGITVTGATLNVNDPTIAMLTTSVMAPNTTYNLTALNITDTLVPAMTPSNSTASFTSPVGPRINSASANNANSISVRFSEDVTIATSTNPANYAVSGGLTVTGVTWEFYGEVILTTSPAMAGGASYTLTAFNITDRLDPPITTPSIQYTFSTPTMLIYSATATSANSVCVQFVNTLSTASATNPASYAISGGVRVTNAQFLAYNAVVLTTSPMASGAPYTLTASNIADASTPPFTTPTSTASFTASMGPWVTSATATDGGHIKVGFWSQVSAATAASLVNYAVSGGVAVTGASLIDSRTVMLTTSPLSGSTTYTLTAFNIANTTVLPTTTPSSTVAFTTPGLVLNTPTVDNLNVLHMSFSRAVAAATATNPANYKISGGVIVYSATYTAPCYITLVTSPMASSSPYTLTVTNVQDGTVPPFTISPTYTVGFWSVGPFVQSASATSLTSITAQFSGPVTAAAADPANYTVSGGVAVLGAVLTSPSSVRLTVSMMDARSLYTLTALNLTDRSVPPITTPCSTVSFSAPSPPYLYKATTTNLVNINVGFSEAVDMTAATNPANYLVSGGVTVTGVVQTGTSSVRLTTSPMAPSMTLALTALSITDLLVPPITAFSATGTFKTPAAPTISSATATSLGILAVGFSRSMDPIASATPSNYALSGGLSVLGVTVISSTSVKLTTSLMVPNTKYTLTVLRAQDTTVPPIPMAPGATRTFYSPQGLTISVGTNGTSAITVWFSEPVTPDTAGNLSNYTVSGGITVTHATVVDAQNVTLALSPMAPNTSYTVTAFNITDTLVPPITTPYSTYVFAAMPAPYIASASTTNVNYVGVIFSAAVDPTSATTVANYAMDQGIVVTGATLAADQVTVTLTTSTMPVGMRCTVTAANIADTRTPPNTGSSSTRTFQVPSGPTVTSATCTNLYGATLVFSTAISQTTATDVAHYILSDNVSVGSAAIVDSKTVAIVTTSPMVADKTYTLTAIAMGGTQTPPVVTPASTVSFWTPSEPQVNSASASNLNSVTVYFGRGVDAAVATNTSHYVLPGGITVTGASWTANQNFVTLTTSPMAPDATYTLTVLNLADTLVPPNVIPSSVTTFTTPAAPSLVSVICRDTTHVAAVFSRAMSAASAADFHVSGGIVVTTASLAPDNTTVILTTSPMTANASYTLTVNDAQDATVPPITLAPNPAMASFTTQPVLLEYTFPVVTTDGATGSGYDPTATAALLDPATSMRIVRGPGLCGLQIADFGTGVGNVLQARPNGFPTLASAIAGGAYVEFTVKAAPGQKLMLTGLSFDVADVTDSTCGWGLQTSVDGLGAGMPVLQSAPAPDYWYTRWANTTVDLSAPRFQNPDGPITFRLYAYTPGMGYSLGFQNLTLYGAAGVLTNVTITSPAGPCDVIMGTTIPLAATASTTAPGGAIATVAFYDGQTLVASGVYDSGSDTWTSVWNTAGASGGLHNLTARATDALYDFATSAPVPVNMIVVPPAVAITSPTGTVATTLGSSVTLAATAATTAAATIAGVEFYESNTKIGDGAWDGDHGVWTFAWDTASPIGRPSSDISFDVYDGSSFTNHEWNVNLDSAWCRQITNNTDINGHPICTIGPNQKRWGIEDSGWSGGGDKDYKDIDVLVTYDAAGLVTQVEILQEGGTKTHAYRYDLIINGQMVCHNIDNHLFETFAVPSGLGLYSITAKATDTLGASATSDPPTIIQLLGPPTVAITSPATACVVGLGTPVALTATASTPNLGGSITGVAFYDGSALLGLGVCNGGSGPWTCTWDTSRAALDTHSLTAVATDNSGLATTSALVSIEIHIPGDGNGDGLVDNEDYGVWQNGYMGANPTFATGDYNGDGIVDGEDYGVWQNNYNHQADYLSDTSSKGAATSVPTAAITVPSTSAASLLAVASPISSGSAPRLIAMTPASGTVANSVTRVVLVFDSDVQVGAGAVEVSGLAAGAHSDYAATYDAATRTLTLTWVQALPAEVYKVRVVADFVVGTDGGLPLDGEVGDPAAATLPSGNGVPGGDAKLEFEVK